MDLDWNEIQNKYDSGLTTRDLQKLYSISSAKISQASKSGLFKPRNKKHAQINNLHGRKHTEKTKQKISVARKKFLKENPDKVPYLLNHSSKGISYPESYFIECLKGTNFQYKYRYGTYELDFADVENKIDLEIDGSQHLLDERIKKHDIERNQFLLDNGWLVIRVYWPSFQSKDKKEKKLIVQSIIQNKNPNNDCVLWIDKISVSHSPYELAKEKLQKCIDCESKINRQTIRCMNCSRLKSRKVVRPSLEQLERDLQELKSFVKVGLKYNVTDNAIRKWIKAHKV